MKKMYPVLLAVSCGCLLALLFFRGIEKNTLDEVEGNAIAVQIGVFTRRENADAMKNTIGGIVLEDEGVYRVYYSVLRNTNNINYVTNYLNKKGVSYYLKRITLNDNLTKEIDDMEILMNKVSDEDKMNINEKLLGTIKEVS